jgi:hypothetical protein
MVAVEEPLRVLKALAKRGPDVFADTVLAIPVTKADVPDSVGQHERSAQIRRTLSR